MKLTDALLVWVAAAVAGMLLLPVWLSLALPLAVPLAMAFAMVQAAGMAWLIENLGQPALEAVPAAVAPGQPPVEVE